MSGRHTGDWQARPVRRRSDEVHGLVVQTEIVLRSRGSAVSARADDDRDIVDTETQRNPRQRRKRTQRTDVLHTRDDNVRSRVGHVSQCRREGRVRSLEAVRDVVEPKLRTRYVGLFLKVLGYRFRDDIPTKLAVFERLVHDYENQKTKTANDDINNGVTMLGNGGHASERAPHLEQREDHKLDTEAKRDSRDHANTTVHRQSTDANAARREFEEQRQGLRQQRQRQRQGRQGQRQGQGCKERIVQESKE